MKIEGPILIKQPWLPHIVGQLTENIAQGRHDQTNYYLSRIPISIGPKTL